MAQTINIANIKVGMDIEELRKGGQFTRGELSNLSRTIKASETPFQKLAKDVALLDRAFAAGGINAASYNAAVDNLAKKHGVAAIYADRQAEANRKLAESEKAAAEARRGCLRPRASPALRHGCSGRTA